MLFKNKIKLFDKSDIHYCAQRAADKTYTEYIRNHTLMYIYSGELIIRNNDQEHTFYPDECVFLRKGSYVITTVCPKEDEKFGAAYIRLKRCFLKDFFKEHSIKTEYYDKSTLTGNIAKVTCTPHIKSLFISFVPYIEKKVSPTPETTNLKMKAGIFSLLNMQAGFYSILFDFRERWTLPWIELF